jgi:hypothetical protein
VREGGKKKNERKEERDEIGDGGRGLDKCKEAVSITPTHCLSPTLSSRKVVSKLGSASPFT